MVKAVVKRKIVLRARDEVAKERCIEAYKKKRKVKRYIYIYQQKEVE